jgi:antitoxin MazE
MVDKKLILMLHCINFKEIIMIKKLTAHGNSAALIIDKPILELLKITMDTPLEISTDGKRLIVAPIISENNREEDIKAALEKINSRRRSALKKLK